MKCIKCNYENNNDNKFCINCGSKLQITSGHEILNNNQDIKNINFKKTKKSKLGLLVCGLLILLIGCFLTYVTFFFFGPFLGSPFLIGGIVLISNYVFNNKTLKIVISILLSILTIAITSVVTYYFWTRQVKYKINIVEKYEDYFNYALGDYTYTYKYEDINNDCHGIGGCLQYRIYTISFYDNLGRKQQIILKNNDKNFENELSLVLNTYLDNKFGSYEKEINNKIEKNELYNFLDKKIILMIMENFILILLFMFLK